MPRVRLAPYPERAKKLFEVTEKDMKRMEKVRSFLQPINVLHEKDLTGQDRILGFRKKDLEKEWARGNDKTTLTIHHYAHIRTFSSFFAMEID